MSQWWDALIDCADEIGEAVREDRGRGYSGQRPTQYHLDLVADDIAQRILHGAGLRVVSEESGVSGDGDLTVVVDPVDGSTNCDRGIPFYSTSLAVMAGDELVAGLVRHHGTGWTYRAERGAGAERDGRALRTRATTSLDGSLVAVAGLPAHPLAWSQFRALGAASLEICLVAEGALDAYMMAAQASVSPWDYLAGMLILSEAGGAMGDERGEELLTEAPVPRRPIAAATAELLAALLAEAPL